jgi:hypothetical protein
MNQTLRNPTSKKVMPDSYYNHLRIFLNPWSSADDPIIP